MISSEELRNRLQAALEADDLYDRPAALVGDLKRSGSGLETVVEILRFMEANPDADFGSPGPLVHFVEEFQGHGYETALVESINRQAASHTVWMLNRVINGATDVKEKARLIEILSVASKHPFSSEQTKDRALLFLEWQLNLPPLP
jgi:hypothetical protein